MTSGGRKDLASKSSVPGCAVVILAGGLGTRLLPLTRNRPKALVRVAGRPLLQWALDGLGSLVGEIPVVVVGGHLGAHVRRFLAEGGWIARGVIYKQSPPTGTAVALRAALECCRALDPRLSTMASVNADTLVNIPFTDLLEAHHRTRAYCTVAITRHAGAQNAQSLLVSGRSNRIVGSLEARNPDLLASAKRARGGVDIWSGASTGVIAWATAQSDSAAAPWLGEHTSLEGEVIPELAAAGLVHAFDSGDTRCIDCGTPARLQKARRWARAARGPQRPIPGEEPEPT